MQECGPRHDGDIAHDLLVLELFMECTTGKMKIACEIARLEVGARFCLRGAQDQAAQG